MGETGVKKLRDCFAAVIVAVCLMGAIACVQPAEAAQHSAGTSHAVSSSKPNASKNAGKSYKIAYRLNGGAFKTPHAKTYRTRTGLSTLPTPVKAGYSFLGWRYRTPHGKYLSSIPAGSKGTKVLHAQWRKRALVAHMGYHRGVPGNSIQAYEKAADKGFRYVETDIRFTGDDKPVLTHGYLLKVYWKDDEGNKVGDPFAIDIETMSLESIQNDFVAEEPRGALAYPAPAEEGPEPVADNAGDALVPADAEAASDGTAPETPDANADEAAPEEEPPTAEAKPHRKNIAEFGEFLDVCKKRNLVANLDLKTGTKRQIRQLVREVDKHGMTGKVRWMSFNASKLLWIKKIHKTAKFSLLAKHATKYKIKQARRLAKGGADAIINVYASNLTYSQVKRCKKAHVALGIWTLSNEKRIARYNSYISAFSIDYLQADRVPSLI